MPEKFKNLPLKAPKKPLTEGPRQRKLCFTAQLMASLFCAYTVGGACNKGHAYSKDSWSLTLNAAGEKPQKLLQYKFFASTWGAYTLEAKTKTQGVNGEKQARLIWQINSRKAPAQKRFLELDLTSVRRGDLPTGPPWDAPPKIVWSLTPTGKTLRFGTSQVYNAVADGLGDPQAYFRRLIPVFPKQPLGKGANWGLKRTLRLPLPEGSGSGALRAEEHIRYEVVALDSQKDLVRVQGKITIRYRGMLEPVGHFLEVKGTGKGRLNVAFNRRKGRVEHASLKLEENLKLKVDGQKRKVNTQLDFTLQRRRLQKPNSQ